MDINSENSSLHNSTSTNTCSPLILEVEFLTSSDRRIEKRGDYCDDFCLKHLGNKATMPYFFKQK
jgi:hypothetical protein